MAGLAPCYQTQSIKHPPQKNNNLLMLSYCLGYKAVFFSNLTHTKISISLPTPPFFSWAFTPVLFSHCSLWMQQTPAQLVRCSLWTQQTPTRLVHTSFCRFHTPSLCVNSSCVVRHLGRTRHSKPHMLNRRLGLSLLYTDTKLLSHWMVVTERGKRFWMSQNTARPLKMGQEKRQYFKFYSHFA